MDSSTPTGCGYICDNGVVCQDSLLGGSEYCFWHDQSVDKSGDEVKSLLEERAETGRPMEGFYLKGANLENLDLAYRKGQRIQLIKSNLNRANLHNAHLYKIDLSDSNLLKADLSLANMHCADLTGCNLLGVNLDGCRLEYAQWGKKIYQQLQAETHPHNATVFFQEAEEVARNIRKNCENQGLLDTAGQFFYQEMVLRRMGLPKGSFERLFSGLVDNVCGYGEKPIRVILFSGLLVFFCSLVYYFAGIQDGGVVIQYQPESGLASNVIGWLDSLYFSVVTFTTLGYGDLIPLGFSRIIAAFEAFIGSFSLALFVVVFVKKMTR